MQAHGFLSQLPSAVLLMPAANLTLHSREICADRNAGSSREQSPCSAILGPCLARAERPAGHSQKLHPSTLLNFDMCLCLYHGERGHSASSLRFCNHAGGLLIAQSCLLDQVGLTPACLVICQSSPHESSCLVQYDWHNSMHMS